MFRQFSPFNFRRNRAAGGECLMSAVWISSAQECTQSVHLTSVSCDSIMRPTGVISCHVDLIPIMVLILHLNSNVLLPYVRILRSYHFVHIFCVSYLYVLMHILCVCIFYHFNERLLSTVLYALFLCLWWKVSNDLNKRLKLELEYFKFHLALRLGGTSG